MLNESRTINHDKLNLNNDGFTFFLNQDLKTKWLYFLIKRFLDIFLSIILIIIFFPLMVSIAIIIKLSSDGKILYKHIRVGYKNNLFYMYKFRSMRKNLSQTDEKRINDLQINGILYKSNNDPRLTKFGNFIRKTSLDELPQLFNVLLGNMSLVGPRPLVPLMTEPFPHISKLRTCIKPGITGMWQVFSRNKNTSIFDMIEWDLKYIERCSLYLDLFLLIKTLPVIIINKGAI